MTVLIGCQILYIATGFIAFVTGTYGYVTGINVVIYVVTCYAVLCYLS